MADLPRRALVISAHPDDESLGVGGTIAKLAERGVEVVVAHVTHGYLSVPEDLLSRSRKEECARSAAKVLGVRGLHFLGLEGLALDRLGQAELASRLTSLVGETLPDVVYSHNPGDLNHDHRLVALATLVACRPHRARAIRKVNLFEVPSSTEWSIGSGAPPFEPNEFELLTERHLQAKLDAFRCYPEEIFPSPHPRSIEGLKILAQFRGAHAQAPYAEAFTIARSIRE